MWELRPIYADTYDELDAADLKARTEVNDFLLELRPNPYDHPKLQVFPYVGRFDGSALIIYMPNYWYAIYVPINAGGREIIGVYRVSTGPPDPFI